MTSIVPFIPDNAPFTAEQRAYLNGLLAGMFSSAAQSEPAAGKASLRIAVLYASQSGTAEGLARKIAKELKAQGHTPAVSTLVGYTPAALSAEKYAIFLASTYGEGDAPEGVQQFYEQLCLEHFPHYENLSFAVFALGDSHYEHFCKFGKDLDQRLTALGANPICDRVDSDVDVTEPFAEWKATLLAKLTAIAGGASPSAAPGNSDGSGGSKGNTPSSVAEAHSREHPALAPLVDKRRLTDSVSSKHTLHLAFSIKDTTLRYEAGDACGVIPHNDPNLVTEILQKLRMHGNEKVSCGKAGMTTLHQALTHHLQITRLTGKTVKEYAALGKCTSLLGFTKAENHFELGCYIFDRGLIDLLLECPGVLQDPADVVAVLPALAPRLYSISSSPAAHAGEIHTTVAVVRYNSHNRDRGGICSTLFADRASVSDRLPIYIHPNKKFRLPKDPDAPIIMIGPGTGIAPFRSFLHERRALNAKGRNWLFFGERSSTTDYLYRDELESMVTDRHLTRLDTAFSRDQEQKIYVQDRMVEKSKQFWHWLQEGASVYVCGDASRMAKDVDAALHKIVETQGGLDAESARDYVDTLKDQHRYHRDVY